LENLKEVKIVHVTTQKKQQEQSMLEAQIDKSRAAATVTIFFMT